MGKPEKEREHDKNPDHAIDPSGEIDSEDRNTTLTLASSKPLPRSLAASPAPSTSTGRYGQPDVVSPTESSGARTPITARPKRNPWTIFISQLPVPVSEDEIRSFFGPAAANVSESSANDFRQNG